MLNLLKLLPTSWLLILFMLAVDPQESCRWGGRGGHGGSIDGQLGKDPQRHCKDYL